MIIGVPKEIMHDEARVAAIPETVKKMVDAGNVVLFEKGAGLGSFYKDDLYAAAGATLVDDVQELYDKADVILKVKEPLFNEEKGKNEVDMMHAGQYIITFIHPAAPVNHEMVKKMAANGIIGITLDGVPRMPRAQAYDALSSMSTCAGYKGILMGASDIPKFCPQIIGAAGNLKPSTVLVIGTGVAGMRACITAKGLGAKVMSADIRPSANENAKSCGSTPIDLGIPYDIAVRVENGAEFAKKLPEEWLVKERATLKPYVEQADIIFCSALLQGQLAPVLLDEDMVKAMKPGSAIVDISIDQGGNCAITTPGKRDVKYEVTIEGIKNIPGQLPTSSTYLFANNICNLLFFLSKDGKMAPDWDDVIVQKSLVCKDGKIVHAGAKEAMGIKD